MNASKNRLKIRVAIITAAMAAAVCMLCATSAAAQQGAPTAIEGIEDPSGIYLGLKLVGSSLHVDDTAGTEFFIKDDGGGLQLDLGYRFNRAFALEISVGGSQHETSDQRIDANLMSVWLFGYYRFCPERPFRPYLKFGAGGHGLEVKYGDAAARIDGGGLALGAGFKYFFNSHFALGLDLTTNVIQYDSAVVALGGLSYGFEIDEDGSLTTLGIQFAYHF